MFWNLFINENTKIFKRSMLWIMVAILAGLVMMMQGLLFASVQTRTGVTSPEASSQVLSMVTWPMSFANSLELVVVFGNMMIIILVGAITAQEYTWRTFHLWLSHGTPRLALSGAKLVSLALPALLFIVTALVTGGLISAVFSQIALGGLPVEEVNYVQLILAALRVAYTLLPYAALTYFLAVATRSTVAAIGGGLAYNLLVEGLMIQILPVLGGRLGEFVKYLPGSMSRALMGLNAQISSSYSAAAAQPNPFVLEPAQAAIGIALWTLVLAGLSMLIFQRQDLSA